jgi:dephospho-CoA kinase
MLIIGLTGLIGSGKTTVTNLFATLGVPIIDTDLIAHEITSVNGIAMPEIIDEFGDQYLDPNGALLRPKMRKLVFKDCAARKKLESILHPIIFKMVLDKIETIKSKYRRSIS